MTLGQRIRQARQQAGLSQRQLCGESITRNMLSLMESDRARPSMATLQLLAQRLGKPVSWFLEEQPSLSPAQEALAQAQALFDRGDYAGLLALECPEPDRLWHLLQVLSCQALAEQAIAQQRQTWALKLLERATAHLADMPFCAPLLRQNLLLSYRAAPEQAAALAADLPDWQEEVLLRAQGTHSPEHCLELLAAAENKTGSWYLLAGQAAMRRQDFSLAAEYFRQAEAEYPQQAIPALEQCYRELEDYKMAYHYACKQK